MRALLPALSALLLAGCETVAYYGQAAGGQLALMGRARPLEAVRADPATGEALKARLALAAGCATSLRASSRCPRAAPKG